MNFIYIKDVLYMVSSPCLYVKGFQLVFDPKDTMNNGLRWSGKNESQQNSLFALHKALTEQKKLLSKKTPRKGKGLRGGSRDISVKLGLGKVFQKLSLTFPDIYITIYKQKVQYQPKPFEYTYQLCGTWPLTAGVTTHHTPSKEDPLLLDLSAVFKYNRMEDYNWNYLDQHVCGYPEFEVLQEVSQLHRLKTLFLLLSNYKSP